MDNLRSGEHLVGTWRRHPAVEAPWIALFSLLLIIPALFSVPLMRAGGKIGFFVFLFLLVVPLIIFLERFVRWWWSVTTITNQRIMIRRQNGIFFRELQEIPYNNIGHVSVVSRGLWTHLWHYGSIHLKAIDGTELTMRDLARPSEPATIINTHVARSQHVPESSLHPNQSAMMEADDTSFLSGSKK